VRLPHLGVAKVVRPASNKPSTSLGLGVQSRRRVEAASGRAARRCARGAQIPRYRGATVRRRPILGGGTSPVLSKYPMTTSDIGRPLSVRFVRRNVSYSAPPSVRQLLVATR